MDASSENAKRLLRKNYWKCSCPHISELLPSLLPPIAPIYLAGTVYQHHILGYYNEVISGYDKAKVAGLSTQAEAPTNIIANEDLNAGSSMHLEYSGEDGKAWALSEGIFGGTEGFFSVLDRAMVQETRLLLDKHNKNVVDGSGTCSVVKSKVKPDIKIGNEVTSAISPVGSKFDGLQAAVSRIPSSFDVQTSTSHPTTSATGDVKDVKPCENDGSESEGFELVPDFKLSENRYQSLKDSEQNIQTLSRSLLDNSGNGTTSMRKLPMQSTSEKKVSGSKRKGSGSNPQRGSRSRNYGSTSKTPLERSSDRYDEWMNKVDQAPISITEGWLEVIRKNRRKFWKRQLSLELKQGLNVRAGGDVCCRWCKPEEADATGTTSANAVDIINATIEKHDDDNLIQCLTCGEIGCGPGTSKGHSHKHIMKHFIITGHSIGKNHQKMTLSMYVFPVLLITNGIFR